MKENDWFLTSLNNIEGGYTNSDYKQIGITANNTEMLQMSDYAKLDEVKNNELFQTNGKFDQQKFENFYYHTLQTYNDLAQDTSVEDAMKSVVFFRDDILAPAERRIQGPQYDYVKVNNPDRVTAGIIRMDKWEEPELTPMEIAESQPIFDPATGQFTEDTPETSFFKNFFKPIVLASWDEDGVHTDPLSGQQVEHKKGELKINPDTGTYYAEFLNGRNAYEKQVVRKLDILTAEGSLMNSIDFFDSDGYEKSWVGSLAKNAVMIAPLLAGGPVAAVWVVANLGLSLVGLGATVNKMIQGSDHKATNQLEGFLTSLQSNVSVESQESFWTAENLINMAGHTFEFLYNMQFIHQKAPALFKGKTLSEANMKQMQEAAYANIIRNYAKAGNIANNTNLQASALKQAEILVQNYARNYQALGRHMATGFMATTFGAATYNEAKAAGATDTEASLMTLASMGMQYGLLKSHIGNWIFPDAKFDALRRDQAIRILANIGDKAAKGAKSSTKEANVKWMSKIFKETQKVLKENYDPTAAGIKGAAAMAAAAGVEMTSFEVMHDISGTLFNFALELNGKKLAKDPMNIKEGEIAGFHPWENMSDRYLSSFIGGAMGGLGLKPWMPFKEARSIKNMNVEEAHRYVIHLIKEGKIDQFLDKVDNLKLGDTNLSAKKVSNLEGEVFEAGTATDNQDLSKKQNIRNLVEIYTNALKDNGGIVSDQQLLDAQIMGEVRFGALLKAKTARKYIERLNRIDTDIALKAKEIEDHFSVKTKMEEGRPDSKESEWKKDSETQVGKLKAELKELVQQKQDLLEGKTRFLSEAIFEMSPALHMSHGLPNFISFASAEYGNKPFEKLTDTEKKNALIKYKNTLDVNFERDLDKAFTAFIDGINLTSDSITEAAKEISNDLTYIYSAQENITEGLKKYIEIYGEEFGNVFYTSNKHSLLLAAIAKNASPEHKQMLIDSANLIKLSDQKLTKYLDTLEGSVTISDIILNKLVKSKLSEQTIALIKEGQQEGLNSTEIIIKIKDDIIVQKHVKDVLETLACTNALKDNYQTIINDLSGVSVNSELKQQIKDSVFDLLTDPEEAYIVDAFDYDLDTTMPSVTQKGLQKFLDSMEITKGIVLSDIYKVISNPKQWETVTEQTKFQLEATIQAAEMYRSYIVASNKEGLGLTNAFGFNMVYNKYTPKELKLEGKSLPEIDNRQALGLIGEIGYIIDTLKYHNDLINSVQKAKTAQEDMIGIKLKGEVYKQHKHLLEKMKTLESWNKEELIEFEKALDKCEILGKDALRLSNEEHKKYTEEHIALDTELGKLLGTKTEKQLYDLFNTFDVLDTSETMSNLNMSNIDIHTYVCYLAKIAAIPSNSFHKAFRQKIQTALAPLPGQAESLYTILAHMAQPTVFDRFIDAFNTAVVDQYVERSSEKNAEKAQFVVKNSKYYLRFNKIVAAQGIPGAGKTKAISVLAREFCPADFNKRVAFVTVEDSKKDMAKAYGVSEDQIMTHEEFMKTIFSDYIRKDKYEPDDILIEDGIVKLNQKIMNETNPYTLIIIDEATHLADLEYCGVNEYATKYDTAVIALGDTDQSGFKFNYTVNAYNETINAHSVLDKNNFVGSFKLGSSFRTSNNYMDQSIESFRMFKNNKESKRSDGMLYHIDSVKGLQGVMVSSNSKSEDFKNALNSMINALGENEKIMYMYDEAHAVNSTLKSYLETFEHKDKIEIRKGTAQGLESRFAIYDNVQTTIIPENVDNYMSDIYTALSRAEQGVILLINEGAVPNKTVSSGYMTTPANPSFKSESIIANYAQKIVSSLKDVEGPDIQFEARKRTADTAVKSGTEPEATPGKGGTEGETPVTIDGVADPKVSIVETDGELDLVEGDGTINNQNVQSIVKVNTVKRNNPTFKKTNTPKKSKTESTEGLPDIHKVVDTEVFEGPLFTNAAHEDGLVQVSETTYRLGKHSQHRIDGAHGVVKLLPRSPKLNNDLSGLTKNEIDAQTVYKLQELLEKISHICLNEVEASEMHRKLSLQLGIADVKGYYEFLSIPEWANINESRYASKYLIGYREPTETQYIVPEGSGPDATFTARHALYYTITDAQGNKLVSVILNRVANPDSFSTIFKRNIEAAVKDNKPLPYDKDFVDLLYKIDDLHLAISNASTAEVASQLRTEQMQTRREIEKYCIEHSDVEGFPTYAKLSYIFRYSSNSSFIIGDSDWTFASTYKSTGPMRAGGDKGAQYIGYTGLLYEVTPTPLVEEYVKPDRTVSNIQVYVNKSNQEDTGILSGIPYVLIGPKTMNTNELLPKFVAQHQNPDMRREVAIKYLLRPTESVVYYTKYLRELMSNTTTVNYTKYQLGNDLTALKIFTELFKTEEGRALIDKGYELLQADKAMLSKEDLQTIITEANTYDLPNRLKYMKQVITGEGTSSSLSRAKLLQGTLVDLMYADHKTIQGADPTMQKKQHIADFENKLNTLLPAEQVAYRVEVKKSSNNYHEVVLQPEFTNAEGEQRHFMFDSKVDSASYTGPVNEILDTVISKVRLNRKGINESVDDKIYYSRTLGEKPKVKELSISLNETENSQKIKDIVKYKLNENSSEEEIVQTLHTEGFVAFKYRNDLCVFDHPSISKDSKIIEFSIPEEGIEKSGKFSLTLQKSKTAYAEAQDLIYDCELVKDSKGNIMGVDLRLRQPVEPSENIQIEKPQDLDIAIYHFLQSPGDARTLSNLKSIYLRDMEVQAAQPINGESAENYIRRLFEDVGQTIDTEALKNRVGSYMEYLQNNEALNERRVQLMNEVLNDTQLQEVVINISDTMSKKVLINNNYATEGSDGTLSIDVVKLRKYAVESILFSESSNIAIDRIKSIKDLKDKVNDIIKQKQAEFIREERKRKDECIPTIQIRL